jgi:meso-butanediol dehydrogenase/(S,S)-butanediol dehydrogenase/diacetyl reductase
MTTPDFSLAGKVALVTGGRRDIGQSIALSFAKACADVAICDRVVDDGALQETAEQIQGLVEALWHFKLIQALRRM